LFSINENNFFTVLNDDTILRKRSLDEEVKSEEIHVSDVVSFLNKLKSCLENKAVHDIEVGTLYMEDGKTEPLSEEKIIRKFTTVIEHVTKNIVNCVATDQLKL
jgi:hypothetical protein